MVHTQYEAESPERMTKAQFLALQAELESLELLIARGMETDATDARIRDVEALMDRSPWRLDPDDGCVQKDSAPVASPGV